jgi:hypothetical protein
LSIEEDCLGDSEMHYRDLEITHKAYYEIEAMGKLYDIYMRQKDVKKWTETVSISEAKKLLKFVRSWNPFFVGKPETFQRLYSEIAPHIQLLKNESLDKVNLDNEQVKNSIIHMFDKTAKNMNEKHQSTDASKILHTILPKLIVMWDRKIREGILKDVNKDYGTAYVLNFLPNMQKEAKEAIKSCMEKKNISSIEARREIEQSCGGLTLAKLLDQHNYVIFTKPLKFINFAQSEFRKGKITEIERKRLLRKLRYR